MQMVPRTPREPRSDLGVLVGAVVVEDQMKLQLARHVGVQVPEKREELLHPKEREVALHRALADARLRGHLIPEARKDKVARQASARAAYGQGR